MPTDEEGVPVFRAKDANLRGVDQYITVPENSALFATMFAYDGERLWTDEHVTALNYRLEDYAEQLSQLEKKYDKLFDLVDNNWLDQDHDEGDMEFDKEFRRKPSSGISSSGRMSFSKDLTEEEIKFIYDNNLLSFQELMRMRPRLMSYCVFCGPVPESE